MNILHYINNLGAGGAEKLLTDILPEMKKQDNKVYVLIANSNKNFEKYEELLASSEIEIINLNTSFYNPFQIFKIASIIKKKNINIVHAHLFPTQYWLAFASLFISKKVKLIKTEHSVVNARKDIRILKYLEKWIYSRYATTIAITEKAENNLKDWIGESSPIVVINNGVNLNQIQNEIKKGTTIKLDNTRYNILMVGRFDGHSKDQMSLIKALEYLPDDVSIYFAGAGPAFEETKLIVEDLGFSNQINFLGLRQDVYAIMNSVDLNVLSTIREGLSGVALESLSSGKPFIGSDVQGVQDVVPSADFLFQPKNPKALAAKIVALKNDSNLSKEMVNISLAYVKKYDTSIMVSKYLAIYQEMLVKS